MIFKPRVLWVAFVWVTEDTKVSTRSRTLQNCWMRMATFSGVNTSRTCCLTHRFTVFENPPKMWVTCCFESLELWLYVVQCKFWRRKVMHTVWKFPKMSPISDLNSWHLNLIHWILLYETILVIFKLCGFLDFLNENYYMVNTVKLFLRVEN